MGGPPVNAPPEPPGVGVAAPATQEPALDDPTTPSPGAADPSGAAAERAPDVTELPTDWGASRRLRPVGPRLGLVGWLRWGWRQLTSMRSALFLLLLLALAAIPGSVLPQRATDPLAVAAWLERHPVLGPWVDRVDGFEVFGSAWFSAVYLLLFISLLGCVIPRLAAHWRALRMPIPPAPRRLSRAAGAVTWETAEPDLLARAAADLRSRRWRVSLGQDSLAAERGTIREVGNLLFHLALVLVLVGVAMGSLWGWKGNVIVRVGEGMSDSLAQYDSFESGRLVSPDDLPPFSLTLERFAATFERLGSQRGAPRSFEATMQYRSDPQAPAQTRQVSVNAPLSVDGAKVFLVGHGYAPHVRLKDSQGRVVVDDTVVFLPQDGSFTSTGVIKAPDADPGLAVTGIFAPTAALDAERGPHSTFPAPDDPVLFASVWKGDLGLDSGVPQSVYSLRTDDLTQVGLIALAPGDAWTFPDGSGSLELIGYERWVSLRVAHDPGRWLALAGALAALAGLVLSLFVPRRRVWIRHEAGQVAVAGIGRGDPARLRTEVHQLVDRMGGPAPTGGAK